MADKGSSLILLLAHRSTNKIVMKIATVDDRRDYPAVAELYVFACI
jgi:hypothetical protein